MNKQKSEIVTSNIGALASVCQSNTTNIISGPVVTNQQAGVDKNNLGRTGTGKLEKLRRRKRSERLQREQQQQQQQNDMASNGPTQWLLKGLQSMEKFSGANDQDTSD